MSAALISNKRDFKIIIWRISESKEELEKILVENGVEPSYVIGNVKNEKYVVQRMASRCAFLLTGINPMDIRHDGRGRPYVEGRGADISIAHSGDFASVMISERGMAGIDIQFWSPSLERVASRFLRDEEKQIVGYDMLLVAWCFKEAVFKAIPGLKIPFYREVALMELKRENGEVVGIARANGREVMARGFFFQSNYFCGYVIPE